MSNMGKADGCVVAIMFLSVILGYLCLGLDWSWTPPWRLPMLNEVETTIYVVTSDPDELEEEVARHVEEKNCVVLKTETVDDRVIVVLRCREEVEK